MMSHLLCLPRELRDQIIDYVIAAERDPPLNPTQDHTPRQVLSASTLRAPLLPPCIVYSAYGLLLTNWQLHIETKECLSKVRLTYAIDIMIVNEELWPTWLSCPVRQHQPIDTMDATFRMFDTCGRPFVENIAHVFGFLRDSPVPTPSTTVFSDLIPYVLQTCSMDNQHANKKDRVKSLNLHFTTTPEFPKDNATLPPGRIAWNIYLGPSLRTLKIFMKNRIVRPDDSSNLGRLDLTTSLRHTACYVIHDRLFREERENDAFEETLSKIGRVMLYIDDVTPHHMRFIPNMYNRRYV